MFSGNATSNCLFAGSTGPADPVDVTESVPKRLDVRGNLVSVGLHGSTLHCRSAAL